MTFRSAAKALWLAEPWIYLATLPWLLFTEVVPGAGAVALIILVLLIGARTIASGAPMKATSFSLPPVLILFVLPYSLWSAPDLQFALPKLTMILAGVFAFALLVSRPSREDGIRWSLLIVLGAAVAIVPLAIAGGEWSGNKVLRLESLYRAFPRLVNQVPRSVAGGFHPNEIAGTVVLLMFPVLGLTLDPGPLRSATRLPMRWGLGLLSGALVLLLLLTQSRGAWAAAALAGMLFLGRSRRGLQLMLLAGGILALVLLFVLRAQALIPPTSESSRVDFDSLVSVLDRSTVYNAASRLSWQGRVEIWTRAAMMLRDYPFLSSGLYQFGLISSTIYGYSIVGPEFKLYHAHNLYAQTAADFGLSGIVFWGLGVIWLLYQWRYPMTWLERGVAAGLTGFMLHGLTDAIPFGQKPTFLVWILIVPLALRSLPPPRSATCILSPKLLVGGSLLTMLAIPLWLPTWHANIAALLLDRLDETRPDERILAWQWRRQDDMVRAGLFQLFRGDEIAAATVWAQAPRAEEWLISRGRLSLARGDLSEARLWFGRALQHPHASASAALGMAKVELEMGQPERAAANLHNALHLPGTPAQYAAAWQQLGTLLLQQARWDEAVEAFQAALRQNPTSASAFDLGVANLQRGDRKGAAVAFAMTRQLAGDSPVLLTRIGEAYRRVEDREGAAFWAALVVESFPDSSLGYRLHARLAVDVQDWIAATSWLERGLEHVPSDAALWYDLARVYWARNDLDAALRATQFAITHSEGTRPLYFILLGDIRGRLGDRRGAEEAYRTALHLNPGISAARERLEQCCPDK